jgi:hypothetical protein
VDGLGQQHVHTIRLLMWDTLEDFTAILTSYVGQRHTLHASGRISTMTDEHLKFGTSKQQGRIYINVGLYGKSRGGDDG